MKAANPINWIEIYVNDLERAKKFYETVLERPMYEIPSPEVSRRMVVFNWEMDKPLASGALVKQEGINAGGNSTIVYFSCEDCAVEESRVIAAGGKISMSKFPIGEAGFCSWCIDTEGNLFGLHSMK